MEKLRGDGTGTGTFDDPKVFQAAIRPDHVAIHVTEKGDYRAELTRVELPRIWIQRGEENLPRVWYSAVSSARPPIFFLVDADQVPIRHGGMDVSFGEIVAVARTSSHHQRTTTACRWGTLALTPDDLEAAAHLAAFVDIGLARERGHVQCGWSLGPTEA